jgi:hypothetical protein
VGNLQLLGLVGSMLLLKKDDSVRHFGPRFAGNIPLEGQRNERLEAGRLSAGVSDVQMK